MKLQFELQQKRLTLIEDVLEDVQERDNNIYRVLFDANPIPSEIRQAGFGGVNRYKNLEDLNNSELVITSAIQIDKITKQLDIQSKSLDEIAQLAKEKEALLKTIPAIQPVQSKDLSHVASGYGMRMHPILKYRRMHNGMDFTASPGTPIYATGDGKVVKAGLGSGYGKMVIIEHGFGNGVVLNPVNFYHNDLSPEEYDIMLKKASIENQSLD